jgi:hypothetical protein
MNASSPLMLEIIQQNKFINFNVRCLHDMHQSLFIQLQHRRLVTSMPAECVNGPAVSCVVIIIIIIIIVSFMQGIHTHNSETNHVPRGYIVAAILSLLFMMPLSLVLALALLFFHVSTFRSVCAVPSMAPFCSSLTSWCPGMSLTYFLNYYYYYYYYYYLHLYAGCVYTYIYVCRLYNVAAVLWFQFIVHEMLVPMIRILYLYICASRSVFALTSTPFSLVP